MVIIVSDKEQRTFYMWYLWEDIRQDLNVCGKCGVFFNLEVRENEDCPVCHSGEHTKIHD